MGNFSSFIGNQEKSALVTGLDNSGKKTIMQVLSPNSLFNTSTEFHPFFERFSYNNIQMNVISIDTRDFSRDYWPTFLSNMQAIVFVVDNSNRSSHDESKDLLNWLLGQEYLQKIPLLVLSHKSDLHESLSHEEFISFFNLNGVTNREWHLCSSSVLHTNGLYQGFQWLREHV